MSSKPYDQFSKELLEELLSPLGRVEVNKQVTEETKEVGKILVASTRKIKDKINNRN